MLLPVAPLAVKRDDAKANAEARNRIESEAVRDSTALLMAGMAGYKRDFSTPEISVFR